MAGDPLWSSVDLLLPCDDASAPPVDVSTTPKAAALVGTPAPTMLPTGGKFAGAMNGTTGDGRYRYTLPGAWAGAFTLEAWIYRNTTWGLFTPRHWIGAGGDAASGSNNGFALRITNQSGVGYVAQVITRSAGGTLNQMNGPVVPMATWTHICFEFDGTDIRFYVDGVMASKAAGGFWVPPSSDQIALGGQNSSTSTPMVSGNRIDEVRFTRAARYASDAGFAVPTAPYPTSGSTTVEVDTFTGSLIIEGGVPEITTTGPDVEVFAEAGAMVLTGSTPSLFLGVSASPAPGQLVITPGAAEVLIFTTAAGIVSQQATLAVTDPPRPPIYVSQQAVLGIATTIPDIKVSQQAVLVVSHGIPCVTARCQCWTITRRDGVVFRYTSHDQPVPYRGELYKPCGSLDPSASENASSLGSVGNMELTGLIDDDGITEEDLYGGKFDDAYVEVDLIEWRGGPSTPRRLASGWTGQLSQGDTSFNMEVLGSSARLEQQALTQPYAPGCRWVFGDARCGVNIEARKLGGEVTSAGSRSAFVASFTGDPDGSEWTNGRIRFTSGLNIGQDLEVKTVDFDTGQVLLWPSAVLMPQVGDAFDLLPGCDKSKVGGCTLYANVINFGGFADVPGQDALLETPDAQY